ncbi:proteasomal ubiquitin receptor ADRM1-B-like [Mya arenaria]|uniref:proteasomal ubiquitin receptor ADRM1-B-like n=1 Tax=Mya arenaria TaxID=6604 RepID=UPI0022E16A82|nr:proteasomal ubiquitin receptor ADRM1-B-like [Mya arenaria]
MASGALFGGSTGRSQSKHLVEFRAGKMHMKGKMVHPDKRKGMVYVHQSDDSLMHFCWKDRTTGSVEDDLIIFPDDIEFKHVKQCTTGRVFVLKFKSSTRKFFFWMQEPKSDKDEEYSKKVNDYLNNPPTPGSSRGGGGGSGLPSELANLGDSDIQSILGGMSQQQLMQLLGGMGGPGGGLSALMGRPGSAQSTASEPPLRVQSSPGTRGGSSETPTQQRPVTAAALPSQTTTTAAPTGGTSSAPAQASSGSSKPAIQLSDLQNILSNMTVPAEKGAIDLSQALEPESMVPILANADVQQRLIKYLPEGEVLPKSEAELRSTIASPQFKQALSSFSSALQSGQLGPLMTQFGLGEDVANAAAQGDLEAFVKAMQANQKSKEKKDEPEAMDQD